MHGVVIARGARMGTPDGQQVLGFSLFREALRRQLGVTVTRVDALELRDVERALCAADADFAMVMVHWSERPAEVASMLRRVRDRRPGTKLVFLDYFAPTSSPFFPVLPYVDCYAKRQVLRDLSRYQQPFAGGFPFTDFLSRRLGFDLQGWHFGSIPDPEHLHKIVPAWNLGVTPRYLRAARLTRRASLPWRLRPIHIHDRFGLPPSGRREWYHEYRAFAARALNRLRTEYRCTGVERVGSRRYLLELAASRVVISPFGWGELCFRDYEAVSCGALLLKPSMEHLRTSPDIFVPFRTYVPLEWDLSDLEDKCRYYLTRNPTEGARVAAQGQRVFLDYFRNEGFVDDIARILNTAGLGSAVTPLKRWPVALPETSAAAH